MRFLRLINLNIVVAMICLASVPVLATTLAPAEKTDPVSGEKTAVQVIISYGNYIYGWESQYDMVFWPLTDENWIWFNSTSGYAAFGNDFEKLSDEDKETLRKWLKTNYDPTMIPKSHVEKLAWLERVYGQRHIDDDFWCVFYRLMAYVHEKDTKVSLEYVKKALPLLRKQFDKNPEGFERMQCLHLLGEYHRRIGENEKAKSYFEQAKAAKYKDKDGKEQVGHPYIVGLTENREKLMNGDSSNEAVHRITDKSGSR